MHSSTAKAFEAVPAPSPTVDLESALMISRFIELTTQRDEAEAQLKELRSRVRELAAQGVTFDDGTNRLAVEVSHTLEVDTTLAKPILGTTLFNRVAEIPGRAVRALLDANLLSQADADKFCTEKEQVRVVVRKSQVKK